jgi:hypothetical protein
LARPTWDCPGGQTFEISAVVSPTRHCVIDGTDIIKLDVSTRSEQIIEQLSSIIKPLPINLIDSHGVRKQ